LLFVAIVFSWGVLLGRVLAPPTARARAAPAVAAAPRPSQTEPPARSLEPSSAPAAPAQGDSTAAQAVLPAAAGTAAEAPAAAPATTPAAAPAPPPSQAAAPPMAASADIASTDKQSALKWFVRKGDSVYKVCQATYGQCDEQTLRAVFAYNPQIGSNALIHQGEIILMPERVRPDQPN
jgi:hypothetical protein